MDGDELHKRPWLRFNLRHLALAVALVAVACWWMFQRPVGIRQTGRELDVAIIGRGYFVVTDPATNQTLYTRRGSFFVNSDGELCAGRAPDYLRPEPCITVPPEMTEIQITSEGVVFYDVPHTTQFGGPTPAGQFQLASFLDPQTLEEVYPGFYKATDESGAPLVSAPGGDGLGLLQPGFLETRVGESIDATQVLLVALCGVVAWLAWEVRKLRLEGAFKAAK